MSARFLRADELERKALSVGYSASGLAKTYGRCPRQIRRIFVRELGQSPKEWLSRRRQFVALALLRKGYLVREVAALQYPGKATNNFSRDFKKVFGVPPSQFKLIVAETLITPHR